MSNSNALQTNYESSIKVLDNSLTSNTASIDEIIDKRAVAEQLLSFKRVSPSPERDMIHISEKEDRIESVVQEGEHHNRPKAVKKNSKAKHKKDNSGRLLPKHAVAILKEWILSPEHFTFPYPTDKEKKILMVKTGLNLKQIKYWFTNARRRLWKQKLVEQQQQLSPISNNRSDPSALNYVQPEALQSSCKTLSPFNPNSNNRVQTINNCSTNTSKPLLSVNRSQQSLSTQKVSPTTSRFLQQQAAATAFLHQQILLQQVSANNTAATQVALSALWNPVTNQQHLPNNNHFMNLFLSNLLHK